MTSATPARVCLKCGYDISGIAVHANCPECGAAIAPSLGVPDLAGIKGGRVVDERPCLRCGYSLRSLEVRGACPECGTPVERSLRGNLLVYSSPGYVARLRLGAGMVVGALYGSIAWAILGWLLVEALERTIGLPGRAGAAIQSLVEAAVLFMGLAGWWLLTTPDPAVMGEDASARRRRAVRVTLIVVAVCAAPDVVMRISTGRAFMWSGWWRAAPVAGPTAAMGLAAMGVFYVARIVKFFLALSYLAALSSRLADPGVRRGIASTRAVGITAAVLAGMAAAFALAGEIFEIRGVASGFSCLTFSVLGIVGLVLLVMYLNLMSLVHAALGRVAAMARAEEGSKGGPPPGA